MATQPVTLVVLAAGEGTRLWPITETIPKAMVKVLDKPLVAWSIESALDAHPDLAQIVIVIGHHAQSVRDYFAKTPYAKKIVFVEQKERLGTAHALLTAKNAIAHDFLIVNADHYLDPAAYKTIFSRITSGSGAGKPFALGASVKENAFEYGVLTVDSKTGRLLDIVEKPTGQTAGVIALGAYFLPKTFLTRLETVKKSARGEYELTDALLSFAKTTPVTVLEWNGFENGISYFWDLLDCNTWALENAMEHDIQGEIEPGVILVGEKVKHDGEHHLGEGKHNIHIGKGTIIRAPCRIEGPVFIGENSVIGPHAFLRKGTVIGNRCHVGSSELKNAVLMDDSNAPHFNYVADSVIGQDVNLGAGSITANLRFDDQKIFVFVKDQKVQTQRRKLGCVIGDGTKVGINVSITCGMLIGRNCKIYPRAFVKANLPSGTKLTE